DGPPKPTSYLAAADVFADDQLYVDTARAMCNVYLALEIEFASGGSFAHTTCGGRMPNLDAIDVTYSVLAAGYHGLNQADDFVRKLPDGAPGHSDVSTTLSPFLGTPH